MLTRCPSCQTVFRLSPEQLEAHHGLVRCGHCLSPFNALDHLNPTPTDFTSNAQTPRGDEAFQPFTHEHAATHTVEPTHPPAELAAAFQPPPRVAPEISPHIAENQPAAPQHPPVTAVPPASAPPVPAAIKKPAARQLSDLDFSTSIDSPSSARSRIHRTLSWSAAQDFPELDFSENADDSAAPIQRSAVPADEDAAPIQRSVAPAHEDAAPIQRNVAPADEDVAPIQRSAVPAHEDAAPIQRSAVPADEYAAPIQRSVAPAHEDAAPIQRSVAPADENIEPIQWNATPAHESVEPIQWNVTFAQEGNTQASDDESLVAEIDKIEAEIEAESELSSRVSIEIDIGDENEEIQLHSIQDTPSIQDTDTCSIQDTRSIQDTHPVPNQAESPIALALITDAPSLTDITRFDVYGKPARGGVRVLWGLIVFIMGMALAGQAIYIFRQDITRQLPGLRPLLVTACEHVACDMPLPRDASLIQIVDSDLQLNPGQPGHYIFFSTVSNRAEFTQDWPYLELTLTNSLGEPLTRRVISPAEWVPPARLTDGLPSRASLSVKLAMEIKQIDPSNYRVHAFYP
ncbi:MAG: zinc-ribbon domain-containing protein [Azoarcus sp.]|nr:zinc-ribbon domain-containing protein [Azoarcus sp.]